MSAKILDDPVRPVVWVVLDETVLRRPVASVEVMADYGAVKEYGHHD